MKPAPFRYYAPKTRAEAAALMAEHAGDAKVLAGGQSLIPTMNFRLAQPAVLVDLNGIGELAYIREGDAEWLCVGAMARQRTVERSPLAARLAPLLHGTMPHIAHFQIRNRGTVGGSLAHADPAAELPAVAVALGANFRIVSQAGERTVDAEDFYVGLFTTDLAEDEILVEACFPAPLPRSGWSIQEAARRHGDYALAGAAIVAAVDETGLCNYARIVFFSVGDGPMQASNAGSLLIGERPTDEAIRAAAHLAATQEIDPANDIHASARYRRHLAEVLCRRGLEQAFQRVSAQ
jgi:carbon-monoxide dehydrogenase medium subunit